MSWCPFLWWGIRVGFVPKLTSYLGATYKYLMHGHFPRINISHHDTLARVQPINILDISQNHPKLLGGFEEFLDVSLDWRDNQVCILNPFCRKNTITHVSLALSLFGQTHLLWGKKQYTWTLCLLSPPFSIVLAIPQPPDCKVGDLCVSEKALAPIK